MFFVGIITITKEGGIMAKSTAKVELFTATKIAEKLGVSQKEIKTAIEKLRIQPDQKKGACNYYTLATIEKIKQAIGK